MAAATPTYTVGARVECKADTHLHVTMAFVGECDEARLMEIREIIRETLQEHPIRFALKQLALFGPKNDIPVIQCDLMGKDVAELRQGFYDRYAQRPPGWTEPKNAAQNYHVTIKNPSVLAELLLKTEIRCTQIFLKQLGPHDPVARWLLPDA
jgi:hypothetical protein